MTSIAYHEKRDLALFRMKQENKMADTMDVTMADFPHYAPPPSVDAKRDASAMRTYLIVNFKSKWKQSCMSIGDGYDDDNRLCVFVSVPEAYVLECRSLIENLRSRLNWSTPVVVVEMVDDVEFQNKVTKSNKWKF